MFDELNQAIDAYMGKWSGFVDKRKNKEFFERLKPTAAAWKVADLATYDQLFTTWREACDQIQIGWLNGRWVAAMHLRDSKLHGDIELIKLMQRRPGADDAPGLDHIDFLDMEEENTRGILSEETEIKWTDEQNGLCVWTSVWFEGTEAKLRSETILDVAIAEFNQVNNKILGHKFARPVGDGSVTHVSEVE